MPPCGGVFCSREEAILENLQIFQNCKYKNNFPLKMARATRRLSKIVRSPVYKRPGLC